MSDHVEQLRAVVEAYPPDPRLAAYLEKVRAHAYKVTDSEVQALKDAGVSEDEIFEQTVAAAISEGLRRLDAAEAVIRSRRLDGGSQGAEVPASPAPERE
jgi:alkylhydroperoxidase family enzyme